jgi:hypothetical protein
MSDMSDSLKTIRVGNSLDLLLPIAYVLAAILKIVE